MPLNVVMPLRVLWKRRALERSCSWTRAELQAHQQRAFDELRRFAYRHSPFYRRFHSGLETLPLTDLPILSKTVLMENFDDLVTDRSLRLRDLERFLADPTPALLFRGRYVVLSTSGSTGQRGIFVFNPEEWVTALASIARPVVWSGVETNPLRPPRTAMLASTSPSHYSSRVGLSLSNPLLPTLRLDATESIVLIVRRLNEFQPEVLVAYPTILRQLADEQMAGRLRIALRHIATSAEVLTVETRKRVRDAWHVTIRDTYGATEYAPIAAECEYGRRHLFEDGAIVEIARERVLLTVFDRRTQPLIRYEISDMLRAIDGECECRRPFRLIDAIEGRQEDILYFPAGAAQRPPIAVHPNAFHHVLEKVAATAWQVRLEDTGLDVYLAGLRDPAACRVIEHELRSFLQTEGALPPRIRVLPTGELWRGATGKAPLIVSRVSRTGQAACGQS